MITSIKWYDAKEVHPARNCDVLIVTRLTDSNKINATMSVIYEDGYFNGKEYSMNDTTVWWAYYDEVKQMLQTQEEDDF